MAPGESILSVHNLTIAFGRHTILENVSFEAQAGDCLAVIGPNGAGKTLLLKALLHLIPCRGEIRWAPGTRIGYVPQKVAADRQLPLRLQDFLDAKIAFQKLPPADLNRVASAVGLAPEILDAGIGLLSGGQFQKALIAFALLGEPNALLFDEPTASLDELAEENIYELLHSLQRDRGMTVILVSHDISVVYRYASRVLCLSKGTPCMGAPREILTPAMLQDLYGTPPRFYRHHPAERG